MLKNLAALVAVAGLVAACGGGSRSVPVTTATDQYYYDPYAQQQQQYNPGYYEQQVIDAPQGQIPTVYGDGQKLGTLMPSGSDEESVCDRGLGSPYSYLGFGVVEIYLYNPAYDQLTFLGLLQQGGSSSGSVRSYDPFTILPALCGNYPYY